MRTFSTCVRIDKTLPSGEKLSVEIRLKDLEETISDSGIDYMLERAHVATDRSLDHIRARIAGQLAPAPRPMDFGAIDLDLFGHQTKSEQPELSEQERKNAIAAQLLGDPNPKAEPEIHIPDDAEVTHPDARRSAYGHHYQGSPIAPDAWDELMTKTGGESGGGQCKCLNTLLQDRGFKGEKRHQAAYYLRVALTGNREPVGTLNVLTKAEATLLIDWLESAPRSAMDLLMDDVNRYQPSFDDEDPFVNAGTDPMKEKKTR